MPRPLKNSPLTFKTMEELMKYLHLSLEDSFTLEYVAGFLIVEGTIKRNGAKVEGRFQLGTDGRLSRLWELTGSPTFLRSLAKLVDNPTFVTRLLNLQPQEPGDKAAEEKAAPKAKRKYTPRKAAKKVAAKKAPKPAVAAPLKAVKKTAAKKKPAAKKAPAPAVAETRAQAAGKRGPKRRPYTKTPGKLYGRASWKANQDKSNTNNEKANAAK